MRRQPNCRSLYRSTAIAHCLVLLGVIIWLSFAERLDADDSSALRARVLSDAPKAWQWYADYWSTSVVGGSNVVIKDMLNKGPDERIQWEFKCCGSCLLVRRETFQGDSYVGRIAGENSVYSFSLTRKKPDGVWVIDNLAPKKPGTRLPKVGGAGGLTAGNPAVSFPTLFQSPDFHIVEASEQVHDGKRLVRVAFSYEDRGRKSALRGGFILLDPELDWLPQKGELKLDDSQGTTGTQTFDYTYLRGSDSHPPILREKARSTIRERDRVVKDEEQTIDFEPRKKTSTPESEYRLAAFGFPEPFDAQSSSTSWYIWLAVAGIMCLVGTACYRKYRVNKSLRGS